MLPSDRPRHLVFASPMTPGENRIKEISAVLAEAGIKVFPPGFPFGLHHEYYRTRIRKSGRHSRRDEIARALNGWAAERENPEDYVWQAVCGGLLGHFTRHPDQKSKLPADIALRMETLRWGEDFAEWARRKALPGSDHAAQKGDF